MNKCLLSVDGCLSKEKILLKAIMNPVYLLENYPRQMKRGFPYTGKASLVLSILCLFLYRQLHHLIRSRDCKSRFYRKIQFCF